MHEYGKGLPLDLGASQRLYRRASQQGHVGATYHLGLMVAYGRGGRQDYREAFSLFQEAASFRSAPATCVTRRARESPRSLVLLLKGYV
jgi:TPR repeat protein